MVPPAVAPAGEFELAGWRVQPTLNRFSREGVSRRVEPKMMDVLVALAGRPGEVLSKDQLADAVWPGLFITESVVTRAIAGLRRALEDDARSPRFIETIARRGYRLLVVPRTLPAATGAVEVVVPPGAARGTSSSPYSPGQWVRGARFHGREKLLGEVLDGQRNGIWLLGSRAVGKTSTLKQLALLAASERPQRYLPLFWDLQGCEEPAALDAGFREALAEASDDLAAVEVRLDPAADEGFLGTLGRLRRAVRGRALTLLLLLDEGEELLALQRRSPSLLRKLRQALQGQEGIRTVLAGSGRLWALGEAAAAAETSPFLHGFAPPLYLGCLEPEAACALASDGGLDAGPQREELLPLAAGHPYLLQLLLARWGELGDARAAAESVAGDPAVRQLFALDYSLLTPSERGVLLAAAHRPGLDPASLELPAGERAAVLQHLERLGMLGRREGLRVNSPLLAEWLRESSGSPELQKL